MYKLAFSIIVFVFLFGNTISANTPVDSLLYLLNDKNIPLSQKYQIGQDIADYPVTDRVEIVKKMIQLSKTESDKSKLIHFYSAMNQLHLSLSDVEQGKVYLDSAYQYIDQSEDPIVNAELCFYLGNYHFNKTDEPHAFEFYRKGLEYGEKAEKSEIIKLKILYRMCAFYNMKADDESMKKYMDEMLQIADKDKSREAWFIAYPIVAAYYRTICNKPEIDAAGLFGQYLDSVYRYDKKMVDLYESGDDAFKKANTIAMAIYYMNYAESTIIRDQSEWQEAISAIDRGTEMLLPTDTVALTRNLHVKARIFFNLKKYDDAIRESLKSLDILTGYSGNIISGQYDAYEVLIDSYSGKGDYKKAWEYEKLKGHLLKSRNEIEKYETIKELETRYEIAEKELEISHLNEERQQILYTRTLAVVGIVMLSIILLAAWLYNRFQHVKKDKEMLVLTAEMKEKELKTEALLKESELKQMRHYLDGLEAEKNRLSKDLHDIVANKLYILEQDLKGIGHIPDSIPLQIEEIYSQTRNISHELISPSFQYTTLPEIIDNHVEDLKERTAIQFHLDMAGNYDDLPPFVAHELYRIIQESLRNVIRHSAAQNVWISLSLVEQVIDLKIKDDGKGFEPEKNVSGIGLQIIQDRTKSLNGRLTIASEANKGCKIEVAIPVSFVQNQE